MSRLAAIVSGPGRRVISPAFNNYGETRISSSARGHAANTRIVVELSAAFPARRCAVVGHSMGGFIALKAMVAGARADALAVYEPVAFGVLDSSDPEQRAARDWDQATAGEMIKRIAEGDAEGGVRCFIEGWNETPWESLPEQARRSFIARAGHLREDVAGLSWDETPREAYAGLAAPTLILTGETSPPVVFHVAKGLGEAVPNAVFQSISGASHMGPITHPEAVAAAVNAFLAGVWA